MNKAISLVERIKVGLAIGSLLTLAGCAGYWTEDYYGDTMMVLGPEPDMFLFGGYYDRGRDAHNYSHRGSESRRVAHPSGRQSHGAVHSSTVQSYGAAHPSGEQRGKR